MGSNSKPHAIIIPFPAQGHMNPMLKFAKILHQKGFHITFVNTEYNHRRLLNSRGPNALDGLPDFQFRTIPDGLPISEGNSTQDSPSLCYSTSNNCLAPLCKLISEINSQDGNVVPPVTCVVGDGVMTFSVLAAREFGIPGLILWTASACGCLAYMHFRKLVERGLIPFKDESFLTNGDLETTIDWIATMGKMRLRDLPSFMRITDPNDIMFNFFIQETDRLHEASAIIMNTFDPLEQEVLSVLSSHLPPIYPIGPIHLLANEVIKDEKVKEIDSNLWNEESECVEWLNSKEANSVVYVNFGSITVMTPQQLIEFAWGLANSEKPFLWIIRPDLVKGKSAVLPSEFKNKIKEIGFLSSWCNQVEVLKHPSVGAFLTHSGWNSTLESISNGVPMISWPFFAEQQTNSYYCCKKWGNGMEIDYNVKRDEIESLVRELMDGKKGKEMKKNAYEWKRMAEEAYKPGGSSYKNLDRLIADLL